MAGYNVRKGVNVSQYLANLNTIPSAHDVSQQEENCNIDDELAQFTNAEFLDFDSADYLNQEASLEFDHSQDERARRESAASLHKSKGLDFVNGMSLPSDHDSRGAESGGQSLIVCGHAAKREQEATCIRCYRCSM